MMQRATVQQRLGILDDQLQFLTQRMGHPTQQFKEQCSNPTLLSNRKKKADFKCALATSS
jgi:hypothetical protein